MQGRSWGGTIIANKEEVSIEERLSEMEECRANWTGRTTTELSKEAAMTAYNATVVPTLVFEYEAWVLKDRIG